MKEFKQAIIWILVAFFLGGAVNMGHKTIDLLWPDAPAKIDVNYNYDDE